MALALKLKIAVLMGLLGVTVNAFGLFVVETTHKNRAADRLVEQIAKQRYERERRLPSACRR